MVCKSTTVAPVLLTVAALAFSVRATGQTANLSGMVTDASRAVVVGASISITKESTGLKQVTSSNALGFYFTSFLVPGYYTITAEAQGFGRVTRSRVKLDPGQDARLDFTLGPAPVKESLTVRGSASSLQTESSAVATEIDSELVHNLPLNGRTFQSLIGLAPGVIRPATINQANPQVGSFIDGQRNNYFTIDGVSANLGGGGGTGQVFTILGTTHNLVSVDDMQEFRLQTSSYSAQYGRAAGGQVDIVTRSGSNQYHGSAFDYFRNEALDANDFFSNFHGLPRAPHRQNDFGGFFGGPIAKDHTFFFASYEGVRLRFPHPFGTSVPSLSARLAATGAIQQLLKAFPLPNGPEDPSTMTAVLTGNTSDLNSSDNSSIRVDHFVSERVQVFGRYSEARSGGTGIGFGTDSLPVANLRSATVGATWLISFRATTDLRLNYSRTDGSLSFTPDPAGGAEPPPDSLLFPAPFASRDRSVFLLNGLGPVYTSGRRIDNRQRQGNLVSNTSLFRGSNAISFGFDYRYLAPHLAPANYLQRIVFAGVPGALSGTARRIDITSSDPVSLAYQQLSVYGQDSWKISPRFTLTYGLRWELTPPPHVKGSQTLAVLTGFPDLTNLQLAPVGTPVYSTTYHNFAPRLGAAYQLRQHPGSETVLRVGFGLFYDLGFGGIDGAASSFPHSRARTAFGLPYPLSAQDAAPPAVLGLDPPYAGNFVVFGPDHQLPRTYEWNTTIDQRLGASQILSVSYVGEAGRDLLRQTLLFAPNQRFEAERAVSVTTNASSSDYHALQAQFQRRMTGGLAALFSYTWSHSIDDTSSDIGGDNITDPRIDRGSSDFDARHAFNAALSWEIPNLNGERVLRALFNHWSADTIFTARTALPVNVLVDFADLEDSDLLEPRPDRVPRVPLYLKATVPGGRQINPAAFSIQTTLRQGNLERNLVRGFPLTQLDFDLRRQFSISERVKLDWRVDFFNALNHANFGLVDGLVGSFGPPPSLNPTFGMAFFSVADFSDVSPLYSVGGPRSIQLSLRLSF
jgi:Carboxypeptidase regulatory-like domain/TonB dependent receptor